MNVSPVRAKKLARSLLRENTKNGRSWRQIAREDYKDRINFATLNRFAINNGAWLPKDEKILTALGLKKAPKARKAPTYIVQKIQRMAARTKTAIMTSKELKREAQEIREVVEWLE